MKRAAREAERSNLASQRAYATALREAEAARKREQSAYEHARRASAAERKQLEKEARDSHIAAMEAEVERLNFELAAITEDLEGILASTLKVDDFVDLETLKVQVVHPPFPHFGLETKTRPPLPEPDPPSPTLNEPSPPTGLMSIFGKKKYEQLVAEARARYQSECEWWNYAMQQAESKRVQDWANYEEQEAKRLQILQIERENYAAECAAREQAAAEQNRVVDELIANLGYGTPDAIEEYIGIVLSSLIYPNHFPVTHEYGFQPETAELILRVSVPEPNLISRVKSYKYTKATDEITEVHMSSKACKERYASAINQVALRSVHEIFEADRRGLVGSISLEVGCCANAPATGVHGYIPFVAWAVSRDEYLKLELANVHPATALAHMSASVSKNPYDLIPAIVKGVRRS